MVYVLQDGVQEETPTIEQRYGRPQKKPPLVRPRAQTITTFHNATQFRAGRA